MGLIQDTIIELSEQMLAEDKMVKYDGEIAPKFGWCTILMGGAGSGKSFARNKYFGIDGKIIDIDSLKDPKILKRLYLYDEVHQELVSNRLDDTMSLGNDEYVDTAHKALRNYSSKLKDQGKNLGRYAETDRLPNVIFDITGKEFHQIDDIVKDVKRFGYKVAIILILADADIAAIRNFKRLRTVDRAAFLKTHEGVLNTLEYIFSHEYNKTVDEFWCILSTAKDKGRKVVFDIKNTYTKFDDIISQIADNKFWVDNPPSDSEWEITKSKYKNKK